MQYTPQYPDRLSLRNIHSANPALNAVAPRAHHQALEADIGAFLGDFSPKPKTHKEEMLAQLNLG